MSTVRSLGFEIGWNIKDGPLSSANKKTDDFKDKVTKSEKETNRLGDKITDIGEKGTKTFGNLGAKVKNFGKVVGTTAIASIGLVGGIASKSAIQSEESFKTIRVGTGATGEALDDLMQTYKELGSTVPDALGETAQVLADLNTRTGATGKTLEGLSKTTLELGRITGEDFPSLVTSSTRAMGDWGYSAENGTELMDKLFITSQSTGIGVGQLADRLVQFGAPLRQMGFDLDSSSALLGKFEKEGVNTELVLGSLRIALGKMAKDGIKDPSKGLSILTERIKNAGSAGEATSIAMEAFGARSGPDMAAAIREGRFEIDDLIESIEKSSGAISQNAKESLTFSERMDILKNKASIALEPLGTKALDVAEKIMPELIDKVTEFADFIMNISPSLEKYGNLIFNIFKNVGKTFGLLLDGNDIFTSLIPTLESIDDLLFEIFDPKIAMLFSNAIWGVASVMDSVGASIKFVADNANITIPIMAGLLGAIIAFKTINAVVTAFNAFKLALDGATISQYALNLAMSLNPIGLIALAIGALITVGILLWKNWDTITEKAGQLWEGIKSAFSPIGDFISGVFEKAWQGVKGFINMIIGGMNNLIKGINKFEIKIPDWLPGGGGTLGFNVPEIPMLANGGNVLDGGAYIAGEKGPELITGTPGATVTPARETKEILNRNSQSQSINVNFNLSIQGNTNNTGDIERQMKRVFQQEFMPAMESFFNTMSRKQGFSVE